MLQEMLKFPGPIVLFIEQYHNSRGSGPRVGELVLTSCNPGSGPRVRELVLTSCNPGSGPRVGEVLTSCNPGLDPGLES